MTIQANISGDPIKATVDYFPTVEHCYGEFYALHFGPDITILIHPETLNFLREAINIIPHNPDK